MMLATVETVTKADPVWESRRHNSNVAAQATARESVHAAFSSKINPAITAFKQRFAAPTTQKYPNLIIVSHLSSP